MLDEKDVIVVGAGPAGLAASIEAAKAGASVLLIDLNIKAGGQLFKQIHKFFGSSAHQSGTRGYDIGEMLVKEAEENGVEIWLQSTVIGLFPGMKVAIELGTDVNKKKLVTVVAKKIIVATGASENVVRFKGWTIPGVMGAGAAQTMVNVNHVKPGNKVVMLGSGNVGLIVAYQLMQAGCEVVALVEGSEKVGGYAVHAAKIRRAGVPIYMKHTIVEAIADEEGCAKTVVIAEVDENFSPIEGTEKVLDADIVTIAAGLKPSVELTKLMNCVCVFDRMMGGLVPLHNINMETSIQGIYVAGDTTGVEEANTALEEGKIAGISAVQSLGYMEDGEAQKLKEEAWLRLRSLRMGPHGEKRHTGREKIIAEFNEKVGEPSPEILMEVDCDGDD